MKSFALQLSIFSAVLAGAALALPASGALPTDVSEPQVNTPVTFHVIRKRDGDCAPDQPSINCKDPYENQHRLASDKIDQLMSISDSFSQDASEDDPSQKGLIDFLDQERRIYPILYPDSKWKKIGKLMNKYVDAVKLLKENFEATFLSDFDDAIQWIGYYEDEFESVYLDPTFDDLYEAYQKVREVLDEITGWVEKPLPGAPAPKINGKYMEYISLLFKARPRTKPGDIGLYQKLLNTRNQEFRDSFESELRSLKSTYGVMAKSEYRDGS